jgi:adenine-specific DNA-methyltransferase
MEKLKLHTPDMTDANIAHIAELFPNCITEAANEEGKIVRSIDFDLLKQELSKNIVEGPRERYQLNWPGKAEALLAANAPIAKTLRPVREESVKFDTTKNLFIEGDNLDVLKLLRETYLGRINVIYIDPPYNTGNDFVYADDFTEDTDSYFRKSQQSDERGTKLVANLESNGRFHSDWLSMMYARLRLSRALLSDDGVIFISIGDDEVSNLNKLCDEIFGGDNFIANFIWEKRTNRENRKVVSSRHDYITCYCKNQKPGVRPLKQLPMSEKALASYKNPDNDPRGAWKSDPATAQAGHGTKAQFYILEAPNGKKHELESGRCWLYTKEVMQEAIEDGRIWFGKDGNGVPRVKTYLDAKDRGLTPESILFAEDVGTNEIAKNVLKEMFDGKAVFETPKPTDLIKSLIQMSPRSDIVLDFFAGSGTTAEAVLRLNVEDGDDRKTITVQIAEECEPASEAAKSGFRTVADIGKERIRRVGNALVGGGEANVDVGFRVLKVDTSNMRDVFYSPDQIGKEDLLGQVDNIREGRDAEDLLFQVLIDWGVDLSLPIAKEMIGGKSVYFVDETALAACFDSGVTEELVKQIAARQPLRVVFRDNGFASDSAKINVDQVFKLLSPSTDVKTI